MTESPEEWAARVAVTVDKALESGVEQRLVVQIKKSELHTMIVRPSRDRLTASYSYSPRSKGHP